MNERQLILVTGGGGFLGRHIVRALQAENICVRVFGQREHPELTAEGVEVHCGDIRDAPAVQAACQSVDGVIHTAGIAGAGAQKKPYFDTNVSGTRNLLQACKEHGVRRMVFTSSPSAVSAWGNIVDGDESLPYPRRFPAAYPRSKAIAEQDVIGAASDTLATC
ncbi:MAG: NAD-dependent epimerase/dehydratase family protein, partial [bacterium]